MPFEITTTTKVPFYRGETTTGYDVGNRTAVTCRAAIDLEEARGDVADIVTDHRRAANALISQWRVFYQDARRWDGEGMLRLTLPDAVVIEAIPVLEGTFRRRVQELEPQERVVDKSLRWVIDAYNKTRE